MNKILMILTSHRLDCFRLCMDFLLEGESIQNFDRVVLLLNGVKGRHLRYLFTLMDAHPEIPWDTIAGPRGRGARISSLQNQCVERYPNALYFKIDEDTFVSRNWVKRLEHAYHLFKGRKDLSLITPVIPNNALGFYHLIKWIPGLRNRYDALFSEYALTPVCDGPVWINPHIAEWVMRYFLDIEKANQRLMESQNIVNVELTCEHYERFMGRFSINCICYDYPHWIEIGGVPDEDELGWGQWIERSGKAAILCPDVLVHHYSFFVQQDWLDRTSLLEDFRADNLVQGVNCFDRVRPRISRILKQLPRHIKNRFE